MIQRNDIISFFLTLKLLQPLRLSTYKIKKLFTLLEMVVTLAVFLILIAIVLTFYDSVFKATASSRNNTGVFSNARVALDVITRDIQCIYYKNGIIPFWYVDKQYTIDNSWEDQYQNDLMAFISATPLPQNSLGEEMSSNLCEVKYQLYNDIDPSEPFAGWIRRSVTGDYETDSWNFQYNFNVGETNENNAFTANDDSSAPYENLISNVTDLRFECYKKDGISFTTTATEFPYSIRVILSLVDDLSWQKYENLIISGNQAEAEAVLFEHERTFTKTIFVGEHGQ
jgi:type II secretory pathway pseudopilin PulG